jgi:energy-coupling factor transport system ATP-binding protein
MIEVHDLSYTYRGQSKPVLRNVSATFKRGEISAIVGANGRGKSTLANILAGLLPLKGKGAGKFDLKGASIGIVFQNPNVQILFDTVHEEIAFVLENHHVPDDVHEERITRALEHVGLSGAQSKNPLHFSLGMKQRVAIATVLALNPDFIVFDEATAMLDASAKQSMLQIFSDLCESGTGVVMVTNIIDELLVADSVLFLAGDDSSFQITTPVHKNLPAVANHLGEMGFDLTPLWQLCRAAYGESNNSRALVRSRLLSADADSMSENVTRVDPISEDKDAEAAIAKRALKMIRSPLLMKLGSGEQSA